MVNVPWHEEVLNFVQTFAALLPDYEVACEHEHSNCVLIAHKKVGVALVLRVHASIPVLYCTVLYCCVQKRYDRGGAAQAINFRPRVVIAESAIKNLKFQVLLQDMTELAI